MVAGSGYFLLILYLSTAPRGLPLAFSAAKQSAHFKFLILLKNHDYISNEIVKRICEAVNTAETKPVVTG